MFLILKIIGIILLALAGLALLLVLLAMFVPIRYKVNAKFEDDSEGALDTDSMTVHLCLSWLLGILYVRMNYPDEDTGVIRLFGIPIRKFGTNEQSKRKKHVRHNKHRKDENSASSRQTDDNDRKDTTVDGKSETGNIAGSSTTDNKLTTDDISKEKVRPGHLDSAKSGKSSHIAAGIKRIFNAIRDDNNIRAFSAVKNHLFKLLKILKPYIIKADMSIGLEDPSQTGLLFGLIGILTVIWPGKYNIVPNFEKKIIKGTITAKGKIWNVVVLKHIIEAVKDDDLKKIISFGKGER